MGRRRHADAAHRQPVAQRRADDDEVRKAGRIAHGECGRQPLDEQRHGQQYQPAERELPCRNGQRRTDTAPAFDEHGTDRHRERSSQRRRHADAGEEPALPARCRRQERECRARVVHAHDVEEAGHVGAVAQLVVAQDQHLGELVGDQHDQRQHGADDGRDLASHAGSHADGGGHPHARGGRQAAYTVRVVAFQDGARAQEADTGHQALDHAAEVGVFDACLLRHHHEQRRAHGHQHVRAHARRFACVLALPAKGAAEHTLSFVEQGGRIIMSPADVAYLDAYLRNWYLWRDRMPGVDLSGFANATAALKALTVSGRA